MDAESSIDKSQTQNEDALEYADSDVEDDDDELNELNGKQQRGDLNSQIIYCFIFNIFK